MPVCKQYNWFYVWLGKLLLVGILAVVIGIIQVLAVEYKYIPILDAKFIYGLIMGILIAKITN